jgi:hypothetical protein
MISVDAREFDRWRDLPLDRADVSSTAVATSADMEELIRLHTLLASIDPRSWTRQSGCVTPLEVFLRAGQERSYRPY